MLIPDLIQDKDFRKKLKLASSANFDNLLDKLITSVDESFIKQCDQFPNGDKLNSLNFARTSMIAMLNTFKTTYSNNTTED